MGSASPEQMELQNRRGGQVWTAATVAVPDKNSWVKLSSGEQELTVFKLRVWQLDYQRAGQVKSGASLHAVRDSMHKNLVGQGNEIAKYPANYSAALLSHDGIKHIKLKHVR